MIQPAASRAGVSPADDRLASPRGAPPVAAPSRAVPLIAHVVYRLDVGGLENGLVNLINAIPAQRYRHAIICLTEYTDFRRRIRRDDVALYALGKRPGKDIGIHYEMWHLLRALRPAIVHTRNLATLDCHIAAAAAGVPCRVHGEHGRDVYDLDGRSRKYNLLRRVIRPLVHRYIPLSRELEQWLLESIHVPAARVTRIYNGVDSARFQPATDRREPLPVPGFAPAHTVVIGAVGRMEPVKDPLNLVRAFIELLSRVPDGRERLRLAMVGDGPLRGDALALLEAAGVARLAWLPGTRDDLPQLLRGFDIFALPSLAEGISNTILEAMGAGLPVVATRVGGNAELVVEGETGILVARADPRALADALAGYVADPSRRQAHGGAGRARIEREFSMGAMVDRYIKVYDELAAQRIQRRERG